MNSEAIATTNDLPITEADKLTAEIRRLCADAGYGVLVRVWPAGDEADKPSGPYPNNRQGRRRWARETAKR
jgi:hypothetical protein